MRAFPAAVVLAAAVAAVAAAAAAGAAVPGGEPAAADGFALIESTVAAVNGEVVFLSDVAREACFLACGAFPGEAPAAATLAQARERYIADVLVLQEQKKLGLGRADNAAVGEVAAEARARMGRCASPCGERIPPAEIEEYVARRLLVRDFLVKRVSVFVEVTDEDVRAEGRRRQELAGPDGPEIDLDAVRREMTQERTDREIEKWYARAASKARIVLSPLEER